MNVPLTDTTGLNIYRELANREDRVAAAWFVNYGPEALQRKPDASVMLNLGKFSKLASVPMPLDVQLRELRKESKLQAEAITTFEKNTFPTLCEKPVSELSVNWFGEKAWHTQKPSPETPNGAPATYKKWEPANPPKWTKKKWDVDKVQYVRETLGAAHVKARTLK